MVFIDAIDSHNKDGMIVISTEGVRVDWWV